VLALKPSLIGLISFLIQLFRYSALPIDKPFSCDLSSVICLRVLENTCSDSADIEGMDSMSRAICCRLG
jgi:hypothetical protein